MPTCAATSGIHILLILLFFGKIVLVYVKSLVG